MANVETISVALIADLADFLRQAVASGEYTTSSEVIRDALSDWKRYRSQTQLDLNELRRLTAEGVASGMEPWEGADALIATARGGSAVGRD